LRESEKILRDLYDDNPKNLMVLRDLADTYLARGDLAAQRSRWRDARLEYQNSGELWEHWPEIGKSSIYDQRQLQIAASLVRNATHHLEAATATTEAR
jgi:hypothetical protein